ncbi:restriction endonuclease subunit S [Lentilactobacillus hilgardii]|nr:type I restriction modification DNA specificity domain protein [Lentilactobacillus hilgardii ATCC 27305]MCT3391051.1 restriction endonuclease subunit S [Lentilactobacillus hilgardii]
MGEIFNIIDGDRGHNYPHESNFLESGNVLFLDTGNVKKNGFNFETQKYISDQKDKQLKNGKLNVGDFVLTSRGTLGNVAYYDKSISQKFPEIRINSAMLILRKESSQHLSNLFLESSLRGKIIDNFMRNDHVGSAQPHITKKDFSKVKLNIPQLWMEQDKVGKIFQNIFILIAANLRQRLNNSLNIENHSKASINE